MSQEEHATFIFCNEGGKRVTAGKAGHAIIAYGQSIESYPQVKVMFSGAAGDTYAKIVNLDKQKVIFEVPELDRPGWYKVKIQTRLGWSKAQHFFYC